MSATEAELFEAFKATGVRDDKAGAAAQALCRRDTAVLALTSDIRRLKWMAGLLIALNVAVLLGVCLH